MSKRYKCVVCYCDFRDTVDAGETVIVRSVRPSGQDRRLQAWLGGGVTIPLEAFNFCFRELK